jgi:hypothetical protein
MVGQAVPEADQQPAKEHQAGDPRQDPHRAAEDEQDRRAEREPERAGEYRMRLALQLERG